MEADDHKSRLLYGEARFGTLKKATWETDSPALLVELRLLNACL